MSRPNASHDFTPAAAAAESTDESDKPAKPSPTSTSGRAPTAHDVSRRAVRSTRTPLNHPLSSGAGTSTNANPRRNPAPGGSGPNRSRTLPASSSSTDTNLPAINTKTVGTGARRRAPTAPLLPQSTRERFDSTHSQRESPSKQVADDDNNANANANANAADAEADADKSFLSIPDPQNRQSTASSFYTNPSSYYSAESNLSFLAGLASAAGTGPGTTTNAGTGAISSSSSPSDSGSNSSHYIPNFRPPAMPTPPIPPLPTNLRMSTSTGYSMPEPSRQSTSDSAVYPSVSAGGGAGFHRNPSAGSSYHYPPWLINSVNAPPMPMPILEKPEVVEEDMDEWDDGDDDDEREERESEEREAEGDEANDGWQMPEPKHYSHHWSNGQDQDRDPGDEEDEDDREERSADGHIHGHGAAPPMLEPEHQSLTTMSTLVSHPMPTPSLNTSLPHENQNQQDDDYDDDGFDGIESKAGLDMDDSDPRMPSHPNHVLSHSYSTSVSTPMPEPMPNAMPTPSTPSRLQTTLPLTTNNNKSHYTSPSSPTNLSPTTPTRRPRPYGSNIMPPVVIPPPPKTPPPVPSPQKRYANQSPSQTEIGLAVGGLWDSPVGVHAHQVQQPGYHDVPPLPLHAGVGAGGRPPQGHVASSTAPLKIQHHAASKPTNGASASQKVDAATGASPSVVSQAHGQAAIVSAGGIDASGHSVGRPGATSAPGTAQSGTPQKIPTKVTITSNSRIEHPAATTSVAGTIPTPASSRPNTHLGGGAGPSAHKPTTAATSSTAQTSAHQTYPPSHSQSQSQSPTQPHTQANAAGRLSISSPQPIKVSTSSGSQGRPYAYNEKISTAPSSSGHAETMQTSSTAALAAPHIGGGGGGSGAGGSSHQQQQQPTRPNLIHGNPSQMDTQYVNMLLALDDIPTAHNLAASFFNWILLAGFILFPGTFTSLKNESASNGGQVPDSVVNAVTQLPLFVVAWVCCGIGAAGMIWLWWRWHKNYIWALNKVFAPALLNSLAGLLSTIASIFGAQHGQLSTTSKSTLIITTASSGVFLVLTAVYSLWLVRRVKRRHDREVGTERTGKHGEGVVDVSKRRHRV